MITRPNPQTLIEFCNYIQPIVNGCSGFIKTDGYMTYFPGTIIIMSADETYCTIINVPVIHNIYMTAYISTFLGLKENDQKANADTLTYFIGWNIKYQHLMAYYNIYKDIETKCKCVYSEPDCSNIPGYNTTVENVKISSINISDGSINYRIPSSKSITPLTKSDIASLRLYDYVYDPHKTDAKTVRYTVFKKKFKFSIDIFFNILVV